MRIITTAAHISRLYLSKWWIVFPNSKSDHLGYYYTESSYQSKEQVEKLNPKDAGIKWWHNFAPPSWICQDEVYFQVSWGTWLLYTSPHPVIQSQSSSLILTVLSSSELVGSLQTPEIHMHKGQQVSPKSVLKFLHTFQFWRNCPTSVLSFCRVFNFENMYSQVWILEYEFSSMNPQVWILKYDISDMKFDFLSMYWVAVTFIFLLSPVLSNGYRVRC